MRATVSNPFPSPALDCWLALDTSTERLSVAVGAAGAVQPLAQHEGPGGAQASATLLPLIRALLDRVGWSLATLDGIVFGRGPGSFTGLRTACAVVQGLAVAARPGGIPVLPLDTLLAVAEAARARHAPAAAALRVVAALDARMDEVYAAIYDWCADSGWREIAPPRLYAPETVPTDVPTDLSDGGAGEAVTDAATVLAGNAAAVYGARLPQRWQQHAVTATPDAAALLRLAAHGVRVGRCVAPAQAQPLYVRDKVALTVDEQWALRAQRHGSA